MSPLANARHEAVLNQYFRGATAEAVTGPILVRLHTGAPGANADQNLISTEEWTNYEDAEVNASGTQEPHFSDAAADGGDQKVANQGAVSFGTPVMDPETATKQVTHFSVVDSADPEKVLGTEELAVAKQIAHGDPVSFPTGALEVVIGPRAS